MNGDKNITYKIRPSARLIHSIGSELIGDSFAALVELVKNSYDADAENVEINFNYKEINGQESLVITVKDDGHGMSFDTVIHKWLVPATNDKLIRKKSPLKNRDLQGRKGIGRFSAAMLGQELTLTSIDSLGEKTTLFVDWRIFDENQFLDDIELLVEREQTNESSKTEIEIVAIDETIEESKQENKLSVWDKKSVDQLINELRKLLSPFSDFEEEKFNICVSFENSPIEFYNNNIFEIKSYPIIELYDYRIHGVIDEDGNALLSYENNVLSDAKQTENIEKKLILSKPNKYCGIVKVDFRVFDRDPEAIENLINKGLIDPVTEKYAGKNEAKRMLNEVYGAKIYKNKFRVRPYGSDGDDWLGKDKDRIQNFRLTVSNNQLVGFITIQSEELSNLEEKSARDGLKENDYFNGLKELSKLALKELELRRLTFRERSLRGRKYRESTQEAIKDLFSFSKVEKQISSELNEINVDKSKIERISNILLKEEKSKSDLMSDIVKTISVYQGQATLGKIVSFILHEGRKPIQFLNSEAKNLERYLKFYVATSEDKYLTNVNECIDGFRQNSKLLSILFSRVDPLASQKRNNKKEFNVIEVINKSVSIFKHSLFENEIDINVDCSKSTTIYGWEEDLFTALTNLIENSIYWLKLSANNNKIIAINLYETDAATIIDYTDNGQGLTNDEIETDIVFEPGYSKKHNGTGLGLAISGEAIERLNGSLKARKSDKGAYFQIEIEKNE